MKETIQPSDISLKSVKMYHSMSEETHCFTATVYVKGKAFCTTSNRGHGGPNEVAPLKQFKGGYNEFMEKYRALEADLAEVKLDDYPNLDNCLEFVVGDLLNSHLLEKEAKRCLKKISFTETVDGITNLKEFNSGFKPTKENIAEAKQLLGEENIQNCNIVILNELPLSEVIEVLKSMNR